VIAQKPGRNACGRRHMYRIIIIIIIIISNSQYCSGYQIEKNEMGGTCSTYGGEVYRGFWWRYLREREHFEDSGVDGWIILRWIFRKWDIGIRTGSIWLRIETYVEHL